MKHWLGGLISEVYILINMQNVAESFPSKIKLNCNFDDLTSKAIGEFGRWQLWISVLMALLKLPMAWYQLNIIFMAPPQEFWCVKPNSFHKYTTEEWRKMCAPQIEENPCLIFDPDVLLIAPTMERTLIALVPCTQFNYDTTTFTRTIVSDWNLVCTRHWLVHIVGGKWRTTIPVLYHLPFGLGNAVMSALAYWLRDWRKLEFSLATLSSLYILYWFVIPESPRWLLATGQRDKAIEVLNNAAMVNNKQKDFQIVKKWLLSCKETIIEAPGFLAFIKSKNMRMKTVLLSGNWFCTGLEFYTFSQYLGAIGGNIFLTVALTGIISIPGGILCVYIITKFGRRTTVWIFQTITAACFLLILFVPKNIFANDWPRLLIAGTGFAGLAGTVPALYLLSGELFPTLGRNAGVGGVTIFARIASMIAPLIVSLDDVMLDLPLIILSIVSFAHLFLLVPLPETKDRPLPDTLEEAEQFN
ncbi:organic cation transporter protein-like isoform X3 [Epargyreus clarus]|uniref:organic cation transporter protein-like isoform X3 n=1 Tax=Epargyreus clarus TaxID=520877 RepID=UPI003C3076B9